MTRVAPSRPVGIVPPRNPQMQSAAAPVAAVAPVTPPAAAQPAPVAPVAETPAAAQPAPEAAAAPKKRGRKPGAASTKVAKAEYGGLFAWNADSTPVMVSDGAGGTIHQRVKLSAVPTDFNAKTMEKLRPADFSDEALYCDFMHAEALKSADAWEKKGKKLRLLGSAQDRKSAAKYLKLREQMEALKAQLLATGATEEMLSGSADDTE